MAKKYGISISTQIRSFYAVGFSSIMISFFNTNLSFRFYLFVSQDANGRSFYDMKNGLTTTVNYEGAAALYIAANFIINGQEGANGMILTIPCVGGASLTLERRPFSNNGQGERMAKLNDLFAPKEKQTAKKPSITKALKEKSVEQTAKPKPAKAKKDEPEL